MKNLKNILAVSAFLVVGTAGFAEEPAMKADNDAINSACAADATTTQCTGKTVGKGLLICLHAYKKAHKEFKFSDSCKAAMRKRHTDKKSENK